MEKVIRSLVAGVAIFGASSALACTYPGEAAFEVPNGATASKEDMIATQGQVKSYVKEIETFLACIDDKQAAAGEELTEEQRTIYSLRYNAAVDAMEQVADSFNAALGAYKDAN